MLRNYSISEEVQKSLEEVNDRNTSEFHERLKKSINDCYIKQIDELAKLHEENLKLELHLDVKKYTRDYFLKIMRELQAILGLKFPDPNKIIAEIKKLKSN